MRTLLAFALLLAASLAAPWGPGSWGVVGPAAASEYLETFEAGKDPQKVMAGTLLLGEENGWHGALADGAYLLENTATANAVRYFYFKARRAASDDAPPVITLSVDVDGRFDGPAAGAGLLYDFEPDSKTYFAFVLGKYGNYAVWRRDLEGFKQVAAGSHDAIRDQGANLLAVRLEGPKAELTVNGARVVSYSTETAIEGSVGIIAIDTGAYRFDNFRYVVQ